MKQLFLLFNHRLTDAQKEDAQNALGIERFVDMPPEIKKNWEQIPADLPELMPYLEPVSKWLQTQRNPGDYALIQGDFGAVL